MWVRFVEVEMGLSIIVCYFQMTLVERSNILGLANGKELPTWRTQLVWGCREFSK